MEYYYGNRNILGALNEVKFWKHQEAEHTRFVRKEIPILKPDVVEELKKFDTELIKMHNYAIRFIENATRSEIFTDNALDYIDDAIKQSKNMIAYLNKLLEQEDITEDGKEIINHAVRESQYFIGIVETIL